MSNIWDINLSDKSILIVEDDRFNAYIIENFLKDTKVKLHIVHSGEKAIEMARTLIPDLILMDIKLPGLDGNETTRLIKQFLPNVIIVAQTAYVTETDKEKAISAGCSDFITKPIKLAKLVEIIKKT